MQPPQRVPWFIQFAAGGALIGFVQGCILSMLGGAAKSLLLRFAYAIFIGLNGAVIGSVTGLAFGTVFYLLFFRGTLTQVIVYTIATSCIASGVVSAVVFHFLRHDGSEMMSVFVMPIVAAITALTIKVRTAVHQRS